MNHSRKKIIIAIFLSVVVFVGGSLSALAKPPIRATLYAAVVDGDNTQAYRNLNIVPYTNMIFGVYSTQTLELGTYLRLYFGLGVSHVTSFSLTLKKLSTAFTDSGSALNSSSIDLYNLNAAGTPTNYLSIRTQVTCTRTLNQDGTTLYNWQWHEPTGAGYDRSVLMVSIPFQSFMIGSNTLDFEMLDFSVNGEETVFFGYEQGVLTALDGINYALNDDSDLPIDTDDVPSAPDTSSINTGTQTGIGYVNDFINEFATGGAVGRVLQPISTYLTVADSFNDNSVGHRYITIFFKLGCGLVIIGFIINGIKRRGDFT